VSAAENFLGGIVNSVSKAAEDAAAKAKEAAEGVQGKLNEAGQSVQGAAGGDGDWSFNSLWAKAQEAAQNAQKAALDVSNDHLPLEDPETRAKQCLFIFLISLLLASHPAMFRSPTAL
jgi:hypothetical protein